MDYEKVELCHNSLLKNIGELCEFLVDNDINNFYELIDILEHYYFIIEKLGKIKNEKVLNYLGLEIVKKEN